MDDKVELGGNIELSGFQDMDGGSMVIVKKLVGHYAKELSEAHDDFSKLAVSLNNSDTTTIACELSLGSDVKKAEVSHANLFMALDDALKKLKN